MIKKTAMDTAWEQFFNSTNSALEEIISGRLLEISASDLKIKGGREPRLMAKMDNETVLPRVFRENHIGILPTTRGTYVLGQFDMFHEIDTSSDEPIYMPLPAHIQSISPDAITSEATALSAAYISGILCEFAGVETLLPTVNGRMGTGDFQFTIATSHNSSLSATSPIKVSRALIEIDAGYESHDALYLIEAKLDLADNFVIRQLYYPFREMQRRTDKPVRPVFLTYTNGVFTLAEYRWKDISHYNSIELVKIRNYTLVPNELTDAHIQELLDTTSYSPVVKNRTPFPQADRIERVINLCELLFDVELSMRAIETEYLFVIRQAHYYFAAARFLGLATKNGDVASLTPLGREVFQTSINDRKLKIAELILTHAPFRETARAWRVSGSKPSKETVAKWITSYCAERGGINPTTANRRASTVLSWVEWVLSLPADT